MYIIILCLVSVFVYNFYYHLNAGYLYLCNKCEQTKKAKEMFAKDKSYYYLITTFISTCISVVHMMFISYIQTYINSFCITEVSKNTFEIRLFIRNKLLKFRVYIKRGPNDILQILDKDNHDITSELEPYFNTKIVDITINKTKYNEIDLYMSDGEVRKLGPDDILKIY